MQSSIVEQKKKWNLVSHFDSKYASVFEEKSRAITNGNVNDSVFEERRLRHIQYLTEIVTVNGRPFKCLKDSGLIGLGSRELKCLQDAGYGKGLTGDPTPAVINHIEYLSSEIMNASKLEAKNSLVSLMVDIGTRNGRDILGLSMQFMRDDQVIIRSIGLILLTTSHTAANIEAEMLVCLCKFDIKSFQVISITSDNASNMLKMVKLFNRSPEGGRSEKYGHSENEIDEGEPSHELFKNANVYDDDFINAEIEGIIDEFNSIQSMSYDELREAEKRDAEILEILDDSSHYIDLLKLLQNDFAIHTLNSNGIKCAVHSAHTAISREESLEGTTGTSAD